MSITRRSATRSSRACWRTPGYKVGIISQPDWKNPASINALGEPRLGFLVMGGNMDSMVNHYTVSKAHRKADAYTPGGVMGKRPITP